MVEAAVFDGCSCARSNRLSHSVKKSLREHCASLKVRLDSLLELWHFLWPLVIAGQNQIQGMINRKVGMGGWPSDVIDLLAINFLFGQLVVCKPPAVCCGASNALPHGCVGSMKEQPHLTLQLAAEALWQTVRRHLKKAPRFACTLWIEVHTAESRRGSTHVFFFLTQIWRTTSSLD